MAKRQLNVQVDEEVQALLDGVLSRHRVSKNHLVEEVLRHYLSFWEEAQRARDREIERQRERLFGAPEPVATVRRRTGTK